MKAQMRFQKYMCLSMIIMGALALLYAFCYSTGSLAELGQCITSVGTRRVSVFTAAKGMNDATLSDDIQSFNNLLMWFGIISILLGVLLYITACNKRRNYYVTNYIATGLCAGGNIIISVVAIILNFVWKAEFLNVDFTAWKGFWDKALEDATLTDMTIEVHYSDSTLWFDIGFAVYAIIIVASVCLLLNMIWKIKLMQGEKKLLAAGKPVVEGGAV